LDPALREWAVQVILLPTKIEQSGPGADLHDYAEAGISIEMSDPDPDLAYARNVVMLTYDLSGFENVALAFDAREFGDEPHFPKDEGGSMKDEGDEGVFGPVLDFDFDGVAVSDDGARWFEARGLRDLSSAGARRIEVDLDAAIVAAGLAYGPTFRVRICQYDNKPKLMDGIALSGIALTGEVWSGPEDPDLRLHLRMDDNALTPLVRDATRNHHQTLIDEAGDPKTRAHSVTGAGAGTGTALAFDGGDDRVSIPGSDLVGVFVGDWAIAFWIKMEPITDGNQKYFLYKVADPGGGNTGPRICFTSSGRLFASFYLGPNGVKQVGSLEDADDSVWRHVVMQREGTTLSLWIGGLLNASNTAAGNDIDMSNTRNMDLAGGTLATGRCACSVDDFRVYSRALSAMEIADIYEISGE